MVRNRTNDTIQFRLSQEWEGCGELEKGWVDLRAVVDLNVMRQGDAIWRLGWRIGVK